jgi:hypothetical protein
LIESHEIDSAALRKDDFEAMFCARTAELIKLVEETMGKPVIRDLADEEMASSSIDNGDDPATEDEPEVDEDVMEELNSEN